MIKAIDKKIDDKSDRLKSGGDGVSTGMIAAILLTILLHSAFLLFKKAPELVKVDSTPPPMVALLPLDSTSETEISLLKWMDIMDPTCFIKPNRAYGFSLSLGNYRVEDIPFAPSSRKPSFRISPTPPLPLPTESEKETLEKIWNHTPLSVTPAKTPLAIALSEYPLWLLDDNSRLPQLFSNPEKIRTQITSNQPPHEETVLKTWFYDGDFYPKIAIEHSCGDTKLDDMAIKTLTFRGDNLGMSGKPDDSPVFISVKWYPTNQH